MHRAQKFGKTKARRAALPLPGLRQDVCGITRTLDGMRIGTDKAAQIIRCMMEGVGVRGTARLAGVARTRYWTAGAGRPALQAVPEDAIVSVPVKDVQADEIWSFVYCKDKTRKKLSLPVAHCGDRYCFVGFERHHKLALAWHIGTATHDDGREFVMKLARACGNHDFQITTDGWQPYKRLIPAFMSGADFGHAH